MQHVFAQQGLEAPDVQRIHELEHWDEEEFEGEVRRRRAARRGVACARSGHPARRNSCMRASPSPPPPPLPLPQAGAGSAEPSRRLHALSLGLWAAAAMLPAHTTKAGAASPVQRIMVCTRDMEPAPSLEVRRRRKKKKKKQA
jgi:hypothetical protein